MTGKREKRLSAVISSQLPSTASLQLTDWGRRLADSPLLVGLTLSAATRNPFTRPGACACLPPLDVCPVYALLPLLWQVKLGHFSDLRQLLPCTAL